MILYLDTSALVKHYIIESGTREVNDLITNAEVVGSVSLTQVEIASAFSKAARLGWIEFTEAQTAWQHFQDHWLSFVRLTVSGIILERASQFAWQYNLRGYDAVHLAAASFWQDTLDEPIKLAAFDRQLWESAQKLGMAVFPKLLAV